MNVVSYCIFTSHFCLFSRFLERHFSLLSIRNLGKKNKKKKQLKRSNIFMTSSVHIITIVSNFCILKHFKIVFITVCVNYSGQLCISTNAEKKLILLSRKKNAKALNPIKQIKKKTQQGFNLLIQHEAIQILLLHGNAAGNTVTS